MQDPSQSMMSKSGTEPPRAHMPQGTGLGETQSRGKHKAKERGPDWGLPAQPSNQSNRQKLKARKELLCGSPGLGQQGLSVGTEGHQQNWFAHAPLLAVLVFPQNSTPLAPGNRFTPHCPWKEPDGALQLQGRGCHSSGPGTDSVNGSFAQG